MNRGARRMKDKKVGALITGIVVIIAVVCVATAFQANASQFVTVSQARHSSADRLHLYGEMQRGTLVNDIRNRQVLFQMKDEAGEIVTVEYKGVAQSTLGEATKLVAIGAMKGDRFVSDQLLVKCPSKYEAEQKPTTVAQSR